MLTQVRQYYRYLRNLKKLNSRKPSAKSRLHQENQIGFYSQFVKKGDLCFDVGANVGDKTEILVALGARVVAVEPQESCWRILKRRFSNIDGVYVINKAMDKTVGWKEIFIDRSPTISSMSAEWIESVKRSGRFSKHDWNYKVPVETTTLDALIEQFGNPVFCKIDVEGFEFEVLQGVSQPISVVSFEFIPEFLEPVLACVAYLSKLGRAEFNYSLLDSMAFALPGWINADEIANALHALQNQSAIQGDIYVRFCDHKIS